MKSELSTPLQKILSYLLVLVCLVPVASCGDDDDDTNPLVGKYQLSEAILTADVAALGLSAGDDITDIVASGFLSVAGCASLANGLIELQEDFELYFLCQGETTVPVKGGTWGANSNNTEITLNLSSPPFAGAIAVTVTEVVISGNILTGKITNLPFSIPGMSAPVLMSFTVKFTKVG